MSWLNRFKSLYDVTDEELDALKDTYLSGLKNLQSYLRDEDTSELKYVDFSNNNAYDTARTTI